MEEKTEIGVVMRIGCMSRFVSLGPAHPFLGPPVWPLRSSGRAAHHSDQNRWGPLNQPSLARVSGYVTQACQSAQLWWWFPILVCPKQDSCVSSISLPDGCLINREFLLLGGVFLIQRRGFCNFSFVRATFWA